MGEIQLTDNVLLLQRYEEIGINFNVYGRASIQYSTIERLGMYLVSYDFTFYLEAEQ